MKKVKVLLLYIVYPLAMGTYFKRALERREKMVGDIELKVTGPFTGSWIPWLGGVNLPDKYVKPPDLPLPFPPNIQHVNFEFVQTQLGDWKPDLVISVDAGINWQNKPQHGVVATVATDPHCLDYTHARRISDKFFNMQRFYSEKDDIYLPYAYDPSVHYPVDAERNADAVLIGMPYEQRIQWVNELRKHGVSVIFENSPVFDEYRELASRANVGLNWSSLQDLNARFFETPAFGLPMVANRVPDANQFLQEGIHWLGFNDLSGAVEEVLYLKNNPDVAREMGRKAREAIQPHTYDERVRQILKECGFENNQ